VIAWLAIALAGPLHLDEVLSTLDERHPALEMAGAKLDKAEAKLLGARGMMDPTLYSSAGGYGGKDPRFIADAGLSASTGLGPSIAGGWRYGQGDFPEYDGERVTSSAGELYVGLEVPLLETVLVSPQQATVQAFAAGRDAADASARDTLRKARRRAAGAYWSWVLAGAELKVEQGLLERTQERQAALDAQFQQGTRAELDVIDNRRAVARRLDAVLQARQKLQKQAYALSLWYRAPDGTPTEVTEEDLPQFHATFRPLPSEDLDLQAIGGRPDLATRDAQIAALDAETRKVRPKALPKISLMGEYSVPLAGEDKPEAYGGIQLKIPLALREGRGDLRAVKAERAVVEAQLRATRDAARAELLTARAAIGLHWERVEAARLSRELAQEALRRARRSFDLGASDLFQLLAREVTLASAEKELAKAQQAYHLAWADRAAALDT